MPDNPTKALLELQLKNHLGKRNDYLAKKQLSAFNAIKEALESKIEEGIEVVTIPWLDKSEN